MARVNAFLKAGNDAGRQVSVGGRSRSDEVWAWLNTDNASKSGCDMSIKAEVIGCGCDYQTRRRHGDDRKSIFTVTLPSQTDENCEVRITTENEKAQGILQIGAMLVTLQGIQQKAEGTIQRNRQLVKSGRLRIKAAKELLQEAEEMADKDLPNVILPGGTTLAHALACVKLVEELISGNPKGN